QRIYLGNNDLDGAILEGEKLIDAHPGNSTYVLALVEILFNNNKLQGAIALVLERLDRYPNQPDLKMAAYTLYRENGELEKSADYISEAFKSPDLQPDMKARGFSEVMNQIKSTARDSLLSNLAENMYRLHPQDPDVLAILGDWELKKNQPEAAKDFYVKSTLLRPEKKVLQVLIPLMFDLQSPFKNIFEMTEVATETFPETPEFWFFHGTTNLGEKNYEVAKTSLEEALSLNKGANKQLEMMSLAQLGDALHSLDEKEEAYDAYEKVLSQNSNNDHILNNYAYFLSLDKKDLDKALNMSGKLVEKHPNNATYLDTHAWVLFQMEKYEEAKSFMEKALKHQDPPSGVMFEHYGDILFKLGDDQLALQYWNKAKELEDTSEFLSLKIKNKKYYD
ncbi:MAG: tetratricopeptide repeat protein, partial [Cyclobacteriaceae bacterium]